MKVSIDLTEDKKFSEGIPTYIKNILANCHQHEYCGGAFAGIRQSSKALKKEFTNFFDLSKINVKKSFTINRFIRPFRKIFQLNFNYQGIIDDDTDVFLYFNNFMPRNKLKCKKITVIHDLTPLYSESISKFKKNVYYKLYQYSVDNSDKIITVSEFSKKDIIDKFPQAKDKIEVVYCGVNYERFQEKIAQDKIEAIKVKYNLPQQYILFVGQARENKNLVRLLEAYSMLPTEIKAKYGLVYANTNAMLDDLARKLNENNVRLLHGIDAEDLVGVYQGASLFTLVSTNEGFGLPIIEAMAAGIPVVCSNVASLPEVAGDAAIMIDPYDKTEISQAILQVLSDNNLSDDLIKKGSERIKQFTWKKSAEKFEKVINDIMKN